jgi:IS30 family transposase
MKYKQLTSQDRIFIGILRKQHFTLTQIAKFLGKHKSTISREINRNRTPYDGFYRVEKAISKTNYRRRESRKRSRYSIEQYLILEDMIRMKLSPAQISRFLKDIGAFEISHETIYKYIRADRKLGGFLWEHLRTRYKKLRKKHPGREKRGRLPDKRSIEERPQAANDRSEIGHWEIDTVMGKGSKDCLLTLVERKTRYLLMGKLKNRTQKEVNHRLLQMIKSNKKYVKTITSDNGTEFHGYKKIEEKTGVEFFFAHPHHSWERGTNENTNGLVRQYAKKGTCLRSMNQWECSMIANKLNQRPREVLNGKSSREELYALTYKNNKERALGLGMPRALLVYLGSTNKARRTA